MVPRWPKDGPKKLQDGPPDPQDGPKRPSDNPQKPQDGPRKPQDGPKRPQDVPRRFQDGPGTVSVAHEMLFSACRTDSSLSWRPRRDTPKEAPGTRHNGQPSQRLRCNMGCGGIRGVSYNPPHPSGVLGVIRLRKSELHLINSD